MLLIYISLLLSPFEPGKSWIWLARANAPLVIVSLMRPLLKIVTPLAPIAISIARLEQKALVWKRVSDTVMVKAYAVEQ